MSDGPDRNAEQADIPKEPRDADPTPSVEPEGDGGLRKMLIAAAVVAGLGVAALLVAIWFAGEPAPLPFDYDGFD